jgi:hypothetical protein
MSSSTSKLLNLLLDIYLFFFYYRKHFLYFVRWAQTSSCISFIAVRWVVRLIDWVYTEFGLFNMQSTLLLRLTGLLLLRLSTPNNSISARGARFVTSTTSAPIPFLATQTVVSCLGLVAVQVPGQAGLVEFAELRSTVSPRLVSCLMDLFQRLPNHSFYSERAKLWPDVCPMGDEKGSFK